MRGFKNSNFYKTQYRFSILLKTFYTAIIQLELVADQIRFLEIVKFMMKFSVPNFYKTKIGFFIFDDVVADILHNHSKLASVTNKINFVEIFIAFQAKL